MTDGEIRATNAGGVLLVECTLCGTLGVSETGQAAMAAANQHINHHIQQEDT